MKLTEKKKELESQLKDVEISYHRLQGAIALINHLIQEAQNEHSTDGDQPAVHSQR
jgi:uncharacterized beta-barrel protein YwiB (DUF1934 family)